MRTIAKPRAALAFWAAAVVASALVVAPSAQAAQETSHSADSAAAVLAPQPEDWPQFGYQGVITDKPDMIYNPTNEFIFPSVFHAGEYFENPLGEWYLYLAPHDSPAGVMLMYADSLDGPWTEYAENPIVASEWEPHYDVSHISSPDAIWNEQAGEMFLYFHGENSVTRYATSDDGIHFDYGDTVVSNAMGGPNVTETSYARVFEHPDPASGYGYGMFYMGNERDDIRRIRLAESVDGINWDVDPDYVVEPDADTGRNVSGGNLWEWNDQLYVIYHGSTGISWARTIDETLREVGSEKILLHQASGSAPDVGRIAAPEIVTDDGETYMFYESGDRLGATIAWAKDGAEPNVDPPFAGFPEDADNPVFAQCAADGSDEFDGAPGPVWDRVLRESDARHTVDDGALVVPTYVGGVAAAPLLQQELPEGAWQVTTELTINATQTFQQAGLLLYSSDTRYAKFDIGQATPGQRVELVWHQDGSNRQDSAAPEVAGATRVWLRLTSDGTDIHAAISYDGESFTAYGRSIRVADAGFTHVGPYAFRGATAAPEIDARFEWLRFSPSIEAFEDCLSGPALPEDEETTAPGPGVLSSTSGHAHGLHDGNFEVRWNLWWGSNASRVNVYENGTLIHTEDLVAAGPAAQQVSVPISGRVDGRYEYTAEIINSQGVAAPAPLTATVKDAAPAVPVLASDNWNGDGTYRLIANLWWGTNADSWRLLEDGVEVAAGDLIAASPAAQKVQVDLTERATGTHTYVIEFSNAAGTTSGKPIEVVVR